MNSWAHIINDARPDEFRLLKFGRKERGFIYLEMVLVNYSELERLAKKADVDIKELEYCWIEQREG